MNKGVMIFLLCLAGRYSAAAFQWPSDPESLSHAFCGTDENRIYKGLQFVSPEDIKPFDRGSVIFRYTPDPFSSFSGGDSTLLVLEHENGFQSVYEGLKEEDVDQIPEKVYDRFSFLTGNAPEEYRFAIRDARLKRLVNPLLLLPGLEDNMPPELESMDLIDGDGNQFRISRGVEIPAGVYKVYLGISDRIGTATSLQIMPYRVSLYNLGSLQAERELDTLIQAGNSLALQDGTVLGRIFSRDGQFYLGEMTLNSGVASLEIVMEDFIGNEKIEKFGFTVLRQ